MRRDANTRAPELFRIGELIANNVVLAGMRPATDDESRPSRE
jgi:hypothetical protein